MHLGATPFSLYNTYTAEQIQYQVEDAEARIVVTEEAFEERVRALDRGRARDRRGDEDDVEQHAPQGFDFDAAWRSRGTKRPAHAHLHLGHHRASEGRAAHAREPRERHQRLRPDHPVPRRGPRDLLAPDGAHRGAGLVALPADVRGLLHHLLPGSAPGGRVPAGGAPDLVLRRAAHLGEAEGRDRGGHRGRAGRRAQAGHAVGARRGPAPRARRGRGGGVREGRRARALEDPRAARARPGGVA